MTPRTPSDLAAEAERQGFKVVKGRHGWVVYAKTGTGRAWLSRNGNGHRLKNMVADCRKIGVIV